MLNELQHNWSAQHWRTPRRSKRTGGDLQTVGRALPQSATNHAFIANTGFHPRACACARGSREQTAYIPKVEAAQ